MQATVTTDAHQLPAQWAQRLLAQVAALLSVDTRRLLLVTAAPLQWPKSGCQPEIIQLQPDRAVSQALTGGLKVDAVLWLESLQQLDSLALLELLQPRLRRHTQVYVSAMFATQQRYPAPCHSFNLQGWQRAAQRCGWRVSEVADNTVAWEQQLQTQRVSGGQAVGSLLDVLQLQQQLQDQDEQITALCEGRLRHLLLRLTPRRAAEPAANSQLSCGALEPTAELEQLFERSFGNRFDAALWQWKYGAGRGQAVSARREGQLIAHYGGASRDIRYFGRPTRALQICDVMVLPEQRGFYSRNGEFFRTAATFLDLHIGYTSPHLLGFGFPNIKAMHVARRLGLYEKTDDFIALDYNGSEVPKAAQHCTVSPMEALPPDTVIDRLWRQFSSDFTTSIVGVRDAAYLRYRYAKHPAQAYRGFQLIGAEGQILALMWIRPHEDGYLLMDVLGARNMLAAAAGLLQQHLAPAPLQAWITRGQSSALWLSGCVERSLGVEIPCNTWSAGPSPGVLAGHWWLTAGDMDFL